eukprot:g8366.t1
MENVNNNNSNTMNNDNSSSFTMNKPATTTTRQAETNQPGLVPLYQSAARNLREYHGVASMKAGNLEKTMALLQLRLGRLVAQGLASRKLLKAKTAMPDPTLDSSSSSSSSSSSNSETEEEEEDVSDSNTSTSTSSDDRNANESRHDLEIEDHKCPIHAALAAAGIKLRPHETRPLLLALGVRPHRLVKLGLVDRDVLVRSSRHDGRGRGIGRGRIRHQQHGPPGRLARDGGEGLGPIMAALNRMAECTRITDTATTNYVGTTVETSTAAGAKEKKAQECAGGLVTTAVPVIT